MHCLPAAQCARTGEQQLQCPSVYKTRPQNSTSLSNTCTALQQQQQHKLLFTMASKLTLSMYIPGAIIVVLFGLAALFFTLLHRNRKVIFPSKFAMCLASPGLYQGFSVMSSKVFSWSAQHCTGVFSMSNQMKIVKSSESSVPQCSC